MKFLPDGLGHSLPAINTTNAQLKIIDSNTSFDGWEKITVCFAFKWTTSTIWGNVIWKEGSGFKIQKMNTGAGQGTGLWYVTDKRLFGSVATEGYEPKVLSVVCDGSTNTAQLYADGSLIRQATDFPDQITPTPLATLNEGKGHLKIGGGNLFSEILIYEDSLDSEERSSVEDYLMGKWVGDRHSVLIDQNGTLKTNSVFDYETDGNYTITVWASDDSNATFDKNFTITVTNVVEDLDGDGIEDHNDTDIDGDGLSNADELLYNSDPWDASSSNRPPSDINASNLTIAENSAIGTVIGEFNATDPDGDNNITYSLIPYPPKLWLDASDPATIEQVDGNLTKWLNKTGGGHAAIVANGNVKFLPDGLGHSLPAINTTNAQLKIIDSNTSFDGWEKITVCFAFKWTTSTIWGNVIWKEGSGFKIQKMNTGAGQGTGLWYVTDKRLFGSVATEGYEPKVLSVVCDGSTNTTQLYADGSLIRQATDFPDQITPTPLATLNEGKGHLKIGGGNLFSEILIYEDSLDSEERSSVEDYLMGKWVGDRHSVLIDQNGTLKTNSVFDYETDGNYTITVWASDDQQRHLR